MPTIPNKPGPGRKSSAKNPKILSHEFFIQNHADIVSCVALIFVVGLMVQATSSIASVFIALHHSISGAEPTAENPRGETFLYETGWKDICAIFFYTLICIIMHAIIQEYLLDKVAKKIQLQSKLRLNRFNESGQMFFFSLMSFVWTVKIMLNEGFISQLSMAWKEHPNHPMTFSMKLFYIIQVAYYLHLLPELYFQRVKDQDRWPKLKVSVIGFFMLVGTYYFKFHRIGVLLLSLHYCGDFIDHAVQVVSIYLKENKLAANLQLVNDAVFVAMRFLIMFLGVLLLFYGIGTTPALIMLLFTYMIEGYQFVYFVKDYFKNRRDRFKDAHGNKYKTKSKNHSAAAKLKESDLPEADQNTNKSKSK